MGRISRDKFLATTEHNNKQCNPESKENETKQRILATTEHNNKQCNYCYPLGFTRFVRTRDDRTQQQTMQQIGADRVILEMAARDDRTQQQTMQQQNGIPILVTKSARDDRTQQQTMQRAKQPATARVNGLATTEHNNKQCNRK